MRVLLLLACTGGEGDSTLVNGGDPYIALLAPDDGDVVCGAPLRVEVEVANLELVAPVADVTTAEPGTGHIDITLNGQDAAMVWETETDLSDVADGEWQLKVELSNADHTAVEPYAGDLVYVTVSADACL